MFIGRNGKKYTKTLPCYSPDVTCPRLISLVSISACGEDNCQKLQQEAFS